MIELEHLAAHIRLPSGLAPDCSLKGESGMSDLDNPLDKAEKDVLLQILEKTNGHRGKAAAILGISRRALQYKLKKYGMIKSDND